MNKYVLDACALIAYFNGEKGADKVEALLMSDNSLYISIINVYEILYDFYRRHGECEANEFLNEIRRLPLTIVEELNKDILMNAAFFKVNFSISLADSIALGLGKFLDAKIITSDHHEFDIIENRKLANFYWLR